GELNAGHVASGLAGIWNDMNEPATGEIAPDRMRFGHGEHSHGRFHNQYALLMAMGTVEGLRAAQPEARTFVLSRAGFAGIQRYAANWMGDNMSRWDHLWLSIPMGSGLGISGQAFVGADVGGFAEDCNPELLARWMQHGALTPFFRNHAMAGTVDQYAWSFGRTIEGIAREAIQLRYRLLPYLYACFLRAAETGAPVQRPLVFDHQWDPQARDIDDQYLLGPDLMVAPVVEPGVRSREVYLPAGGWYDWHTGEYLDGGRWVTADAPLERIPLFARDGAVIPMLPEAPPSTAGLAPREIELHVFLPHRIGQRTTFFQEDDGETLAHAGGARVRTTVTVTQTKNRWTVRGDVDGAPYEGYAREALTLVFRGTDLDPLRFASRGEPFEIDRA
ncbi:MAG: alpha-glucosidase, partial [Actinobacteria bacterium]|nr:alpha-glucosidase [Actinomycetota bacterium]